MCSELLCSDACENAALSQQSSFPLSPTKWSPSPTPCICLYIILTQNVLTQCARASDGSFTTGRDCGTSRMMNPDVFICCCSNETTQKIHSLVNYETL